jgi:lactate dehydrogenase-like 2-hydroxyacid dehydrogenase
LNNLLKNSDFIFPALTRNEETKEILTSDKLDLIPQNSFIVSITDEDLFDFEYVYQKIKSKEISGLAMESEKRKTVDYEGNVYITPPIA